MLTATDNGIKFYSQRMLNPFHGIVNAVEIPGADAVSRDGLHWSLYVQHLDNDGSLITRLPDIKFGEWDEASGLKRAPVRYVTNYSAIDHRAETLLQTIKDLRGRLPFEEADCYELWMIDRETGGPLALLNSSCEKPDCDSETESWRAGISARKQFASEEVCLALERLINEQARSRAQWILRNRDGGGVDYESGQEFAADIFPELMVKQHWDSAEASALVKKYLYWQAPWLLELGYLDRATRLRLESDATKRAQMVSARYRNYPVIEDPGWLKAVLVEAKLRDCLEPENENFAEEVIDFFQSGN